MCSANHTAKISVGRSRHAIVDLEDLAKLSPIRWFASTRRHSHIVYAHTHNTKDHLYMHHFILGVKGDPILQKKSKMGCDPILQKKSKMGTQDVFVDHINGNGLDNRKSNLRICTHQQNCENSRKRKKSFSKYKGVYWSKNAKKWVAQITIDGKSKHLGYFELEEDAAAAYDKAAVKYFGEFACLNFRRKASPPSGVPSGTSGKNKDQFRIGIGKKVASAQQLELFQ